MGRFAYLVDSSAGIEGFRALYKIPRDVSLRYCPLGEWHTHKKEGEVTIPMGRVTKEYLITHRLCPHQCTPNLFRVLGRE